MNDRQNMSKRVLQSLLLKKRVAHPYVGNKIDHRIDGNDSDKKHDAEERDALEVNIGQLLYPFPPLNRSARHLKFSA